MGREWTQARLGDVTLNHDARRVPIKGSERKQGPFPYYGASGIVDYVDDYLFDGEYLLIAEDGENLRTRQTPYAFLAKGKFWVNNHAHIISGSAKASTRFVHYALQEHNISAQLTGAVMPKLTQSSLNAIPLLLPSPAEQTAISDLLSALDDKITLNGEMSATLERIARKLFQSWFVDFNPVRRAIDGEDIGLPAHIAALFPARLTHNGLPEGWTATALPEMATFLNGLALQRFPAADDVPSLPVIKIAEMRTGTKPTSARATSALPSEDYIVNDGDHLFSWSGSLTHCLWSHGPGALNQHLFKVIPTTAPAWLCYFAVDHFLPEFQRIAAAKAVTMGHIQRHHLDQAVLAMPPQPLLRQLGAVIEPMFERLKSLSQESRTLNTLRDTLLPKLISGELRIRDVEKIAESA